MVRRKDRKQHQHTNPDHRPMLPVFRIQPDPIDRKIRSKRRIDPLIDPKEYINWR